MAIIPPHRPGISQSKALEIAVAHIEADPGARSKQILELGVIAVAFRGYFNESFGPTVKNDVGYFDDGCMLINFKTGESRAFNWNTDPSRLGYNKAIGKDFAILSPGVYMFQKGQHKNKGKAWRQLDDESADDQGLHRFFSDFRARGEFGVFRGKVGSKLDVGYHAINIHWGDGSTSSWGCQTCPGNPASGQYLEWQRLSYAWAGPLLPYVLIDNDVEHIV